MSKFRITVGQLRDIIREVYGGSLPDETYDDELLDDPTFKEESTYVPDDIKDSIKKWAKDMGLHTGQRRKRS
jgi:hypothetical protein